MSVVSSNPNLLNRPNDLIIEDIILSVKTKEHTKQILEN